MTTKPTATAADPKASTEVPPLVGTMPSMSVKPETITLSHHLRIESVDYKPGDRVRVSPDFARRLRTQGYVART